MSSLASLSSSRTGVSSRCNAHGSTNRAINFLRPRSFSSHILNTPSSSGRSSLCRPPHARRSGGGGGGGVDIQDRIVASLPYLLPLLDGVRYGRFFFMQFPEPSKIILTPLLPLLNLYNAVPFGSLAVFFGIYLGIIQNQSFSRYVRYNAMQAVVLDILLVIPGLLESILGKAPMSGFALQLYINAYNTIWLFVLGSFLFAVGKVAIGQTPRLPLVADAADAQIRG